MRLEAAWHVSSSVQGCGPLNHTYHIIIINNSRNLSILIFECNIFLQPSRSSPEGWTWRSQRVHILNSELNLILILIFDIYNIYTCGCAYGVIDMHAVKMCYQPSIVYNIIIVGLHISISQSGKSKCTLESCICKLSVSICRFSWKSATFSTTNKSSPRSTCSYSTSICALKRNVQYAYMQEWWRCF